MRQSHTSNGKPQTAAMGKATAWRRNGGQHAPLRQERERLATYGRSLLSDRELLALLVGTGAPPTVSVHSLVERLLAAFGSVPALARAHPADLTLVKGLGPAGAARLAAAFALAGRISAAEPPVAITTAQDVVQATRPLLYGHARERLVVVICNKVNRLVGVEILSDGSADRALLPVRETITAVLRRDGLKFALAHNHPSGDPTPSPQDITATLELQQAAKATGLRLVNHVVVTDTDWRTVPVDHWSIDSAWTPERRAAANKATVVNGRQPSRAVQRAYEAAAAKARGRKP